ncbi:hypothetical protein ASG84_01685 [Rhodococcus sp. Leaf278]|uniref:DUF3558 domain-containing protein n=1 Tax=Rhodococcus sp. Leaf278 TaxID=1736319 RepID=UPI00070C06B3|nr:DUF3558 domain-containing protein [Rhodococcus sp. Leaf278]KQU61259.1 hypothetical protein ASG84_01685 [Rhodococcus sp. Leaf278]
MTPQTSRTRRVIAAAATLLLAAGCSQTVEGTPRPASFGGSGGEEFTKLLTECDAVSEDQITETVGADLIAQGFLGAICRWDLVGSAGTVKVTFNWFESGTLAAERAADEKMMYTVSDTTVQGRKAIQAQRPNDSASCGVSAGADQAGIFGWWVQYRPDVAGPDPCQAAAKLADLTLNLSR